MTRNVLLIGLLLAAAPVRAAGDHEILAAQQELKIAKDHLQAAGTDYEGHRREAMRAIDEALREIRLALEVSKRRSGTEPKRGREPAPPASGDD